MRAFQYTTFAAAILVSALSLAGIAHSTSRTAANVQKSQDATVTLLPPVYVRPSQEQIEQLRRERAQGNVTTANAPRMPYYSFAADSTGA